MEDLGCHKEPVSVEEYGGALSWLSTVSLIAVFLCGDQCFTSAFLYYSVQVQLTFWFFEVAFICFSRYVLKSVVEGKR